MLKDRICKNQIFHRTKKCFNKLEYWGSIDIEIWKQLEKILLGRYDDFT